MKKILIVMNSFGLWGIEKALISLLNSIPENKYDVYLMLLENRLQLKGIPKYVKLLKAPFSIKTDTTDWLRSIVKCEAKRGKWINVTILFFWYLSFILFHNSKILKNFLLKKETLDFDYVFNFWYPSLINSIISEDLCICKKKYIRLHFDILSSLRDWSNNFIFRIKKLILKYRHRSIFKYDLIFCVSNEMRRKIESFYKSEYQNKKLKTLYNIIDKNKIIKLWEWKWFVDNFDWIRILSVWRLLYLKWFDIACNVCKWLVDKWYHIRWYIIGNGKEKDNLLELIKKNNLENYFILLWGIENPYPYFKWCDIYVQPSRSEAFCLALAEAKIFNKPIVTTKFPWASEQIKDGKTWLLVDVNVKNIENALESLIIDEDLRKILSNNLREEKNDKILNSSFSDLEQFL